MINLHKIAAILEDTCSDQIGDREEIGSGSVNGVEEEEEFKAFTLGRKLHGWCYMRGECSN